MRVCCVCVIVHIAWITMHEICCGIHETCMFHVEFFQQGMHTHTQHIHVHIASFPGLHAQVCVYVYECVVSVTAKSIPMSILDRQGTQTQPLPR